MNKKNISGQQLRQRLLLDGFSAREIADRLGVTTQNLTAIFHSKNVQKRTLKAIGKVIGKKEDYFLKEQRIIPFLSGPELKEKLNKNDITIPQLAELLGATTQNLYAILRSKNLRLSTIRSMSIALNKPIEWFSSFEIPETAQDKEHYIKALEALIEQQKKYIAVLEERLTSQNS